MWKWHPGIWSYTKLFCLGIVNANHLKKSISRLECKEYHSLLKSSQWRELQCSLALKAFIWMTSLLSILFHNNKAATSWILTMCLIVHLCGSCPVFCWVLATIHWEMRHAAHSRVSSSTTAEPKPAVSVCLLPLIATENISFQRQAAEYVVTQWHTEPDVPSKERKTNL